MDGDPSAQLPPPAKAPSSGSDQTLIRRFTGSEWEGMPDDWIRAKTGSMDGVEAFAAIVRARKDGARYVVVSLRNHFPETREQARSWEEKLVRTVVLGD